MIFEDFVYVEPYVEYVRVIQGDLTGRLLEEISSPVAVRWNTLRAFKRIQGVYDGGRFCLSFEIRAIPWKYPTRRTKEDAVSLAVYRARKDAVSFAKTIGKRKDRKRNIKKL